MRQTRPGRPAPTQFAACCGRPARSALAGHYTVSVHTCGCLVARLSLCWVDLGSRRLVPVDLGSTRLLAPSAGLHGEALIEAADRAAASLGSGRPLL